MNAFQRLRMAADQQLPQSHNVTVHKLDLDTVLTTYKELMDAAMLNLEMQDQLHLHGRNLEMRELLRETLRNCQPSPLSI